MSGRWILPLLSCVCILAVALGARAEITDFDPDQIAKYLRDKKIDSLEKFVAELPAHYRANWIMMARTESSQQARRHSTAVRPRLLLQSEDAKQVFGLKIDVDPTTKAYLDSKVEYMQWEPNEFTVAGVKQRNTFRFHLIDTKQGTVVKDDPDCQTCHHERPNWDAYDSWGGMLPFNRDRLYENSIEADAFVRIFTELQNADPKLRDPVVAQLRLPPGISHDGATVKLDFSKRTDAAKTTKVKYRGSEYEVPQGGNYILFDHTKKPSPVSDPDPEGRAIAMFDHLSALNAIRVAQEILDRAPKFDVRFIALAIANNCVTEATLGDYVSNDALKKLLAWHDALAKKRAKDAAVPGEPAIADFKQLLKDTKLRRESLPKLKADLQYTNLTAKEPKLPLRNGLIAANGYTKTEKQVVEDLFRRTNRPAHNVDTVTNGLVDRELYSQNEKIALFRLFLEPAGVKVWKWSMSSRSRSTTYTFGDVFEFGGAPFKGYNAQIIERVGDSLKPQKTDCADLAKANRPVFEGATFVDLKDVVFLPGVDTGTGTTVVDAGGEGRDFFVSTDEGNTGTFESWFAAFVDTIDRGADGDPSDLFYTGEPPPPVDLDVDGDGTVGSADAARVTQRIGVCFPDPDYDLAADFDGDGCITDLDLAWFDDAVSDEVDDDRLDDVPHDDGEGGDGAIDGGDEMTPGETLGLCLGEPGYDARADLDGDGCVTAADDAFLGLRIEERSLEAPML